MRGSYAGRTRHIRIVVLEQRLSELWQEGLGNIVFKERYGKINAALFRCKTCGHCFSESRGTPFFGLNTPTDEVLRTLALLPEKGSIRGVARATGNDKNKICRWLDVAGMHCKEVTDYYLKELQMNRVQVDEIWSYIKKRKKIYELAIQINWEISIL